MPSNSWKAGTFPVQLGNTNPRPVGVTNRGWLPFGIVSNPSPDHLSPSNWWVQRGASPHNQGSDRAAIQGHSLGGTTTARELCVLDFPRRKERWWPQRPVVNLKCLNQLMRIEHFKKKGLNLLPDLIQPGHWMIKLDLKDASLQVPIHPDHPGIRVEQPLLLVQMSPIWVVHGPKGLHQIAETSSGVSETSRMSPDNLRT